MSLLTSNSCKLRAVDPTDLDFIYALENNPALWEVGNTVTPYSKYTIREYLENAHRDIYEVKQLRLAITTHDDQIIGVIDLYDFDPFHKRAGVGIVISNEAHRQQGYASDALQMMID